MSDTTRPAVMVWPTFKYRDAPAAITFLKGAFGFEEGVVYPSETDASLVDHAELRWPLGGGVMLGSIRTTDTDTSNGQVYVVTDDADALFARATAAGAIVVRPLTDQDYGSRDFSVRDPEGNLWSFGTYAGE